MRYVRIEKKIITMPRISGASGSVGHTKLYTAKKINHEAILPQIAICVS
jgi:hypothetical protein